MKPLLVLRHSYIFDVGALCIFCLVKFLIPQSFSLFFKFLKDVIFFVIKSVSFPKNCKTFFSVVKTFFFCNVWNLLSCCNRRTKGHFCPNFVFVPFFFAFNYELNVFLLKFYTVVESYFVIYAYFDLKAKRRHVFSFPFRFLPTWFRV